MKNLAIGAIQGTAAVGVMSAANAIQQAAAHNGEEPQPDPDGDQALELPEYLPRSVEEANLQWGNWGMLEDPDKNFLQRAYSSSPLNTIDARDQREGNHGTTIQRPPAQGVKVLQNFLGQVDLHQIGRLFLGLQEGVVALELSVSGLLSATETSHHLLGRAMHKLSAAERLPLAIAQAKLTESGNSLTEVLHGIEKADERPRIRRWVDEMMIGLGPYSGLENHGPPRVVQPDDPDTSEISVTVTSALAKFTQLNESIRHETDTFLAISGNDSTGQGKQLVALLGLVDELIRHNDRTAASLRVITVTRKLTPDMVEENELHVAYQGVRGQAALHNLAPLIERPAHLLQVPLTIVRARTRIQMRLEVPLVPFHSPVYEILKAPNSLLRTQNGHLLQLSSNSVILQKGSTRTTIPTQVLETACVFQSGNVGCVNSLQFEQRKSCETELMVDDDTSPGVLQCLTGLSLLDPYVEHASQVGQETFDWYSPTETKVRIQCRDGREESASLAGLCRVELERGCTFATNRFILDGPEAAIRRQENVNFVVHPTRIAKVLGLIQVPSPEQWTNLTTMVNSLTTESGYPSLGAMLDLYHKLNPKPEDPLFTIFSPKVRIALLLATKIILCVILVILFVYKCSLYVKSKWVVRKTRKFQNVPDPSEPEVENVPLSPPGQF